MSTSPRDAAVLGGGQCGTILAELLAAAGRRVLLWVRDEEVARQVNERRANDTYLPGVALSQALAATTDLGAAVNGTRVLLLAIPAAALRSVARLMAEHLAGDQIVVHTVKGLEPHSGQRMTEVLREESCALKIGVLACPVAVEALAGQPAAALVASRYDEVIAAVQGLFAGGRLSVYGSRDVAGTELFIAFGRVAAIGAGAISALGLGTNAKAILITRALAEMTELGRVLGAEPQSASGLAGAGELLACTLVRSSSYLLGEQLGRGQALEVGVALPEGAATCHAVAHLAAGRGLDLPLLSAIDTLLGGGTPVADVLADLLGQSVDETLGTVGAPRGRPGEDERCVPAPCIH